MQAVGKVLYLLNTTPLEFESKEERDAKCK